MKRIYLFIENIIDLNEEVEQRDLFRKHRSLVFGTKLEASDMLIMMEAIAIMTGYDFLIGNLR